MHTLLLRFTSNENSGPQKDEQKGDATKEPPPELVKELGKSKWSNYLDEDDVDKSEATRGNSSALSSLVKSYSKKGKSVRWADQVCNYLFSFQWVRLSVQPFRYENYIGYYLLPRCPFENIISSRSMSTSHSMQKDEC